MQLLLAEDDLKMSQMLKRGFAEEGYVLFPVPDGEQALQWALTGNFDLILLDVMLPILDGFEVARRYRRQGGETPILMLTARDGTREQIEGLDAGADDYLTKPFLFDILLARVRALTRRHGSPAERTLSAGACELHPSSREVFVGGAAIHLTKTEFDLLALLLGNTGHVIRRETLIETVWGPGKKVEDNTLDTFVRQLRCKLRGHNLIETVRGVGYMIRRSGS
jgi:two-component system, OmpR family, response regulator